MDYESDRRRDPVAGADRFTVAGRARGVSAMQTLYRWFRRWQRDGVWAQILDSLQARADAAGLIGWTLSVDSTISRAHQHAAGARRDGQAQKEPPGGVQAEPADHGSADRGAGGPPRRIWPASRAAS
jgi:hypothetical protein